MRHRDRFRGNPRMGQIYATWDRMAPDHRETVLAEATGFLARLETGEPV
jgi:deoxyribodipyrimidine photolyase-related protein